MLRNESTIGTRNTNTVLTIVYARQKENLLEGLQNKMSVLRKNIYPESGLMLARH